MISGARFPHLHRCLKCNARNSLSPRPFYCQRRRNPPPNEVRASQQKSGPLPPLSAGDKAERCATVTPLPFFGVRLPATQPTAGGDHGHESQQDEVKATPLG